MSIHGICFDEGQAGNCGLECQAFIDGDCDISDEILENAGIDTNVDVNEMMKLKDIKIGIVYIARLKVNWLKRVKIINLTQDFVLYINEDDETANATFSDFVENFWIARDQSWKGDIHTGGLISNKQAIGRATRVKDEPEIMHLGTYDAKIGSAKEKDGILEIKYLDVKKHDDFRDSIAYLKTALAKAIAGNFPTKIVGEFKTWENDMNVVKMLRIGKRVIEITEHQAELMGGLGKRKGYEVFESLKSQDGYFAAKRVKVSDIDKGSDEKTIITISGANASVKVD